MPCTGLVPERSRQGEEGGEPGRGAAGRSWRPGGGGAVPRLGGGRAGRVPPVRGPLLVAADRAGPPLHAHAHRPRQGGRLRPAEGRRGRRGLVVVGAAQSPLLVVQDRR